MRLYSRAKIRNLHKATHGAFDAVFAQTPAPTTAGSASVVAGVAGAGSPMEVVQGMETGGGQPSPQATPPLVEQDQQQAGVGGDISLSVQPLSSTTETKKEDESMQQEGEA